MSKKDMLGPITRALVGLPTEHHGVVLDVVNKLSGTSAAQVKSLLVKALREVKSSPVIDCDDDPFVPEGWSVKEGDHQKGGQLVWDTATVELWLSRNQLNGEIEGNKLLKELASQPVLNANVLDFLLANPDLIPEEWKGKAVFFWGTIYRCPFGFSYVRYLCWRGGRWVWDALWLGHDWRGNYPALVSCK